MKAAVFTGPDELSLVDRALPPLQAGEALVRVAACGICGTDLHILEGTSRSKPPVVLGHEYAGIVMDMAGDCATLAPGSHVAVDPNIACGACFYCRRGLVHLCSHLTALGVDRDGGLSEFSIVPFSQLYSLPEHLPLSAAALIEPLSCAIHGVDRAGIRVGDTVVILGGGTIGLMMLQLVRRAGAARVIVVEPIEQKRTVARTLGADTVLNPHDTDIPSAIFDLTSVGADVVLECAGRTATAELSLRLARRGGTVEFFGVCPRGESFPASPHDVYVRELTIVGSYVNPHTFARAVDVLASGIINLDILSPSMFTLDRVHDALRAFREGKTIKTIIRPGEP